MVNDQPFGSLIDQSVIVTGPTAAGKTEWAIRLAGRIGGQIVSMDSIAVYRGMDIGTAKPSDEERRRVVHHLIDVIAPDTDYSVARYLHAAHAAVEEIRSRGDVPIFVGGTPMYLKAILRGFDPGPPADWEFRERVEADLKQHGIQALYRRLQQVDPLAAAKIDPNDSRRMIRALEVARLTGQPLSHRQIQFDHRRAAEECRAYVIQWPRELLRDRIASRVDAMFEDGLVEEVAKLIEVYGSLSRTAAQAVGYRELIRWHQTNPRTRPDLDDVKSEIVTRTHQMARRQETWFRSFDELTPINGEMLSTKNPSSIDVVVDRIEQFFDESSARPS